MNYMQVLSSLLGGAKGKNISKLFKKKRNNNGWILLSAFVLTIIGVFGGKNKQQKHQTQSGSKVSPVLETKKGNIDPFQANFKIATEIAEELKPDTVGPNRDTNKV